MGPADEDRWAPPGPTMREPLIDIDVKPSQPGDPQPGLKQRRRRLSDTQAQTDEPDAGSSRQHKRFVDPGTEVPESEPQPEPRHRRLLGGNDPSPREPRPEPQPEREPKRPRLVDVPALPEDEASGPMIGRPRGAVGQQPTDVPGLQTVCDPPPPTQTVLILTRQGEPAEHKSRTDTANRARLAAESRATQGFRRAAVGGLGAAAVGALIWALVAMMAGCQANWMAIGVGLLVAGTVRTLGRGLDRSFGYLGAAMSAFGCLLGNLLSIGIVVAVQEDFSLLATLEYFCGNPVMIPGAMLMILGPMDLVFYAIAIYAAYRFSRRRVKQERMNPLAQPQ